MADKLVGATRAAVGQGLAMGWGDEAEAWLRSKMGQGSYEDLVKQIRGEQAQYSEENPFVSGASEFVGGVLPGAAMMFVPGGQAAGAAQMQRSGAGALAKLAGLGAATGAVSGAGSATEDNRVPGAITGAAVGTVIGGAAPVVLRGAGAGARWLRERLAPTEGYTTKRAGQKMTDAMQQSKMTPQQIEKAMATDAGLGVPSVVANVNPALADLAEAVAQRTGAGARNVEETLQQQRLGTRERTHQQVVKGLKPGDYYDDLAKLEVEMKTRAGPMYDQAYAFGEVADPNVLSFLKLPQFQQGMREAQKLLAAEDRTMDFKLPTVEVLDQTKRGIDTLIEHETDKLTGKVTQLGRVYVTKKNEFLKALDAAVPDYGSARRIYAGGAELREAMRAGLNDFGRLDHEQVIKLIGGMGQAEKEAFRTGVSRDLYDKIMKPSGNFNAAQRIIGAPEMQAKLQPLFDSPAHFDLFKNAMEREAQLFSQSNRILGGSQTGKRMQMREELESGTGVGEAIAGAVTGGFWGGLTGLASKALRSGSMTEDIAAKLSNMLMAKDPNEVAAVVKMLEKHAAESGPRAFRAGAAERGAVTGTASAIWPSPTPSQQGQSIENAIDAAPAFSGPDIEEAIRLDTEKALK